MPGRSEETGWGLRLDARTARLANVSACQLVSGSLREKTIERKRPKERGEKGAELGARSRD